ncbi:MAG TPA: NotI family restriction endonuclease [Caldilineaceae bacterium]|nr:NotI family restriction endonuclease [Caldilineaceae bacterium]
MAEVFGYRIDDLSDDAIRHRRHRLCPFNNIVPSCTKDRVSDPLGVCSVYHGDDVTIICPVRFREGWRIATDAAEFFFSPGTHWTAFSEVQLDDADGRSAGKIDVVLASYDDQSRLLDFGALEVQAVYISGNIRNPFTAYMQDPEANTNFSWRGQKNYPRADFLSSSRKRLAPQLIYKGGILHAWGKKMAVAVDRAFFSQLPELPQVEPAAADVAWFIYDLIESPQTNRYRLTRMQTIYTQFTPALLRITTPNPGSEEAFRRQLQQRLTEKRTISGVGFNTLTLSALFTGDQDEQLVVDED